MKDWILSCEGYGPVPCALRAVAEEWVLLQAGGRENKSLTRTHD